MTLRSIFAAAITLMLAASTSLNAAPAIAGETEHFFYRAAPEGPYIDSQRDNKAFGFGSGKIFLSEDNAESWAHRAEFPDADKITWSVILKNGNILFATSAQLFLSKDNLKTHRAVTVKKADGSDYIPHTPVDPALPGWYFHSLDGEHCFEVEGKEMLVWGNYCNVVGGAVPVNIYYSTDSGETVKLAYSFGQNKHFQQPAESAQAPERWCALRVERSRSRLVVLDGRRLCVEDRDSSFRRPSAIALRLRAVDESRSHRERRLLSSTPGARPEAQAHTLVSGAPERPSKRWTGSAAQVRGPCRCCASSLDRRCVRSR